MTGSTLFLTRVKEHTSIPACEKFLGMISQGGRWRNSSSTASEDHLKEVVESTDAGVPIYLYIRSRFVDDIVRPHRNNCISNDQSCGTSYFAASLPASLLTTVIRYRQSAIMKNHSP